MMQNKLTVFAYIPVQILLHGGVPSMTVCIWDIFCNFVYEATSCEIAMNVIWYFVTLANGFLLPESMSTLDGRRRHSTQFYVLWR